MGRKRNEHIYRAIVEDWKMGDYTIRQLAAVWSRSPRTISHILAAGGTSARDKQYRDKRIGQLYRAGYDAKYLSERYGLDERYVVTIAWKGAGREHERACPVCGKAFTPRDNRQRHCSRKCLSRKKHLSKTCIVCAKAFTTQRPEQKSCSNRCSSAFEKIKNMERNLRIRDLRRQGYSYRELSRMLGLSRTIIFNICSPSGSPAKYMSAIESVRSHKGKSWLSSTAKLEIRRAERILKEEGLYHYFCSA